MTGYALLIPEFLVLVGAFWALFAERLPGGDRGAAWVGAALAAAAGVIAAFQPIITTSPFGTLLAFDGPARAARAGIAGLAAVWFLWTAGRGTGRLREAVCLAQLALVGSMFMCSARELITLFLALELGALPSYVLIGYRRDRVRSLEGALKYFLLSILTSLVMLYGFSLLYGLTGTTRYAGLDVHAAGTLGLMAVLFALVGILAKLTAAPFHYWAPDAYAGADAWTVAFVATVPKVAGAIAMLRLIEAVAPGVPAIGLVLAVVAAISMLLGNIAALNQTDIRRMMAYSGVGRTGYLLVGVAALSLAGYGAALFYAVAYALPAMGIMLVAAEEGPAVEDFDGLSVRRPFTAWGILALVLSLIGIPPLVGFFAKFYLFTAAVQGGYIVLVVIAVMMSVLSAGYYFRIVRAVFFAEPKPSAAVPVRSPAASVALALLVVAAIAAGLAAGPLFGALGTYLR